MFGYRVQGRASPGFSAGPWRCRGEARKGRRRIPVDAVLALWRDGLSCREISRRLGRVRGMYFCPDRISVVICNQRKARGAASVPFHRVLIDDNFVDRGISTFKQRALGL